MTLPDGLAPGAFLPKHVKSELDLIAPIGAGSPKKQVKLVQERLDFAGFKLSIDAAFGPATTQQLKTFQSKNGLQPSGRYTAKEHELLTAPFVNALASPHPGDSLGETIVAVARQHIAQKPVEIGGQNCGPWVRMYMDGLDGPQFLWCAGFCFGSYRLAG